VRCAGAALTNALWNLFRSRHGVLLTVLLITLVFCILFDVCALALLVELLQLWAFPCPRDFRPRLVPAALANAIIRRNSWWFARHHHSFRQRNDAGCLEFLDEALGRQACATGVQQDNRRHRFRGIFLLTYRVRKVIAVVQVLYRG
jgi:hypothetical protein